MQVCVCVCVGVLIKAAHLQPIKEPLSSISPNLLKHAACKVSGPFCTLCSDFTPLPLAEQLMVPGPVILSGMLRDAFRCIWPRNRAERPAETSVKRRFFCSSLARTPPVVSLTLLGVLFKMIYCWQKKTYSPVQNKQTGCSAIWGCF